MPIKWETIVSAQKIILTERSLCSAWGSPLSVSDGFSTSVVVLNLLLNDVPRLFTVRVGTLIAGVLLFTWAIITGALAWERSGVPVLIVGNELKSDGLRYRLSLSSKDKPYDTSVRLLEIVDHTGREIVQSGRLNIDLEWTHHSGGDVHIRKNHTETVSIASLVQDPRPAPVIRFTGVNYGENIMVTDRVYFHLRVAHEPKAIDRWFCFRNVNSFLQVSNEEPPVLTTP